MDSDVCHLIQFGKNLDQSGSLVFMQENKEIPFKIKRVYYLFGVPSSGKRGTHAHKDLRQVLIALSGRFEVIVDNGYVKDSYLLANPREGLYVGAKVWRELKNFSSDAICLVLASALYDPSDYIRDYDAFLSEIKSLCV